LNLILKIFKLFPPEFAHFLSLSSLKILYRLNILNLIFRNTFETNNYSLAGLNFKNRLGTAAGIDKNGDYIDELGALGFGFLEVGTVTPEPQNGNEKPRVFRIIEDDAIINRLGFNNKGVDYLVKNLKKRHFKGIVGVNIGANKNSAGTKRVDDYLLCIDKVHKYADYITINISSPNTPDLRNLHNKDHISDLINSIDKKAKEIEIKIPIFLKISPDETNETLDNIIELIKTSSFTGIVATNTTIDKSNINDERSKKIEGGLSGRPLMKESTSKISYIKSKNKDIPLIAVGGVLNKEDYQAKINSGASLVQIYTGFVIKGPDLVNNILQD
tara:strand:+ start:425 stop:1414 length:990 start_codon:yes stop_codon:yes gene_type:complete